MNTCCPMHFVEKSIYMYGVFWYALDLSLYSFNLCKMDVEFAVDLKVYSASLKRTNWVENVLAFFLTASVEFAA